MNMQALLRKYSQGTGEHKHKTKRGDLKSQWQKKKEKEQKMIYVLCYITVKSTLSGPFFSDQPRIYILTFPSHILATSNREFHLT